MTEDKPAAIRASGVVDGHPGAVYEFLSDLRNHWRLTDRWVQVLDLTGPEQGPTGGWVELRGPLGIRRRLRTTVIKREEPSRITGMAELMPSTRAAVTWLLESDGSGRTHVRLEVKVISCGPLDRVLLSLGAARWLGRRFEATLRQLAEHLDAQPLQAAI